MIVLPPRFLTHVFSPTVFSLLFWPPFLPIFLLGSLNVRRGLIKWFAMNQERRLGNQISLSNTCPVSSLSENHTTRLSPIVDAVARSFRHNVVTAFNQPRA